MSCNIFCAVSFLLCLRYLDLVRLRFPLGPDFARQQPSPESIEVMADGRFSDQPAPWRSRYQHNRSAGSKDTIPTATIVLAGGDSIVLKHATTNQISETYRAVKATRHVTEMA